MTVTEKNIISTFKTFLRSYSLSSRETIYKKVGKSKKTNSKIKEEDFFKTFGSFSDNKSAEEIISNLKNQRNFKTKEITF
ncbi:hypothetical protein EGI22_23220 [Lacihabitans sp. LS3-19]|uniref:hypothetical protein n=1 Tax=Lacihabitans sp. LS3-19 TaxID=2487335 RepID=UPI0020CBCCB6|nr:hypothetical protein [Lacihabitans sp. LS3-19]MCP9770825.1 hypothetical protein [Lacihabitans sp. LS3-19]